MSKLYEAVCVVPTGDRCGEGAVWHAGEQALYWVDVNRFLIHRLDPATRSVLSWFFDEAVAALSLTNRDDTLTVCLGSKIILWKPATDERKDHGFYLKESPFMRLNDARPDPRGSLWAGTMRNNVNPDGSEGDEEGFFGVLYRIDPDRRVTEWRHHTGISNTVCWSPDRTKFYTADSARNYVCVFRYDASTGAVSDEQPFLVDHPRGNPDGSAVDSEGYLWNCRYGGGCILRIAPNGEIDRIIEVPAANITTCTFGGPDLKTLYVTTAGKGGPPGDRLGGSLFAVKTEAPGLPENKFQCFG